MFHTPEDGTGAVPFTQNGVFGLLAPGGPVASHELELGLEGT